MTKLETVLLKLNIDLLFEAWEGVTPLLISDNVEESWAAFDVQIAIKGALSKRYPKQAMRWFEVMEKTNNFDLSPRGFFEPDDGRAHYISALDGLVVRVPRNDITWAAPVDTIIISTILYKNTVHLNVNPVYMNGYCTTAPIYTLDQVIFTGEKI